MIQRGALEEAVSNGVALRPGSVEDVPAVLRMMDTATEWLVKQGRTGQWGTEKHSDNPNRIKQCTEFAESGGLWIATDTSATSSVRSDGPDKKSFQPNGTESLAGNEQQEKGSNSSVIIGALTVGEAMPYVEPATEPELYVRLLLTDRTWAGRGIGTILLNQARKLAGEAGVSLLRVDCYAGGDGKLVRFYESQGFERVETFEIKGWPGQVLIQRL